MMLTTTTPDGRFVSTDERGRYYALAERQRRVIEQANRLCVCGPWVEVYRMELQLYELLAAGYLSREVSRHIRWTLCWLYQNLDDQICRQREEMSDV